MRRVCSIIALSVVASLGSAARAQTGDLCNDAIVINGNGSFPFNNAGFANEMTAPCAPSSADIFFIYTPSSSGIANIDTCGSSFDTVLAEVLDCFLVTACSDDSDCGLQSRISVPVYDGLSIFIRVAAYGGGTGGPGVLNINVTPPAQWDEDFSGFGDAGDLPPAAQVPTGTNPFTEIGGTMSPDDADMFLIEVCDVANFSATTFGGTSTGFDTRLYLFTPGGVGVTFNDDVPTGFPGDTTLLSRISGTNIPGPGQYYLGVTQFDNRPLDAGAAQLWNETPFDIERAPDGPGAAAAVASWSGGGDDSGSYRIALTGACFVPVGPSCDTIDFNGDGLFPDTADIDDFLSVFSGGPCSNDPLCGDIDFNNDGLFPDTLDIDSLLSVFSGGACL